MTKRTMNQFKYIIMSFVMILMMCVPSASVYALGIYDIIESVDHEHDWSDWELIEDATITKAGQEERFCWYCDEVEVRDTQIAKAYIKLNTKKVTLYVGESKTLKVSKAKGDKVSKFTSSKKSVATVSSSGKIKAKKKGTTTITVKLKSGKKATCKVTVKTKSKPKKKTTTTKKPSGGGKYWVPNGSVYHSTKNCATLKRSRTIYSSGCPSNRRPCKVCH